MDEKEQNMLYMSELKAKAVCLEIAGLLTELDKDTGYFKQKDATEDVRTRCNLHYQRNLELLFEGKPRPEGFQTAQAQRPPQEQPHDEPKQEPRDATLPMKKCIWGLAFGTDADPELANELAILGLTKFNTTKVFIAYDWAHEFIDRNKKS